MLGWLRRMYNLLPSFFNDSFFNQGTITIYNRALSYDKGHAITTPKVDKVLKCNKIIVPVNVKDLVDKGLGQYNADRSFQLYVSKPLKFQSGSALQIGDLIEYNGGMYKLLSGLDFSTHGFYNYYITKMEDKRVND